MFAKLTYLLNPFGSLTLHSVVLLDRGAGKTSEQLIDPSLDLFEDRTSREKSVGYYVLKALDDVNEGKLAKLDIRCTEQLRCFLCQCHSDLGPRVYRSLEEKQTSSTIVNAIYS
jgi:hypothetical protein